MENPQEHLNSIPEPNPHVPGSLTWADKVDSALREIAMVELPAMVAERPVRIPHEAFDLVRQGLAYYRRLEELPVEKTGHLLDRGHGDGFGTAVLQAIRFFPEHCDRHSTGPGVIIDALKGAFLEIGNLKAELASRGWQGEEQ